MSESKQSDRRGTQRAKRRKYITTPLELGEVFYAVLNETTNTLLAPTFNDKEAAERFRLLHAMPRSRVVTVYDQSHIDAMVATARDAGYDEGYNEGYEDAEEHSATWD